MGGCAELVTRTVTFQIARVGICPEHALSSYRVLASPLRGSSVLERRGARFGRITPEGRMYVLPVP